MEEKQQTSSLIHRHPTHCVCIEGTFTPYPSIKSLQNYQANSECSSAPSLKQLSSQKCGGERISDHSLGAHPMKTDRYRARGDRESSSMFGLRWYKAGRRDSSPLTCSLIQRTARMLETLISDLPPRYQVCFCHQEVLFGGSGLFQGRQLWDALPEVLPREKAEIGQNDKANTIV